MHRRDTSKTSFQTMTNPELALDQLKSLNGGSRRFDLRPIRKKQQSAKSLTKKQIKYLPGDDFIPGDMYIPGEMY